MRSIPSTLAALAAVLSLAPPAPAREPGAERLAQIEELEAAGDLAGALDQLESAARDAPEPEALPLAAARQRLLHRLGRLAEAQAAGERWIELAQRQGGGAGLARALWQTGRSYGAQGRHREAAERFGRALAALDEGAEPALAAELRIDRATVLGDLGAYLEAEALLAAAADAETVAADPRLAVKLFSARGTLLERAGDPLGALAARERALERARAGSEPRYRAIAAINLAQSRVALHDYALALATLEEALAPGVDRGLGTLAQITAGICHFELNRLDEAERAFEEGRRLAAAAGHRAQEAWALGELGLVRQARGDTGGALGAFDAAIAACRAGGDARNEAVWWANKGRILREQGRNREALASYARAEALERALPGSRPSANLRKQIAQSRSGLGELAEAERLFDEALALARERGDTKTLWESELELARLYRATGRTADALTAALAALDGIETIRSALRLETFESDFFEDKVAAYREAIDLALGADAREGAAHSFELAERARARAFLGSLAEARAGLEETLPEELVRRERRLLLEISELQAAQRRDAAEPGAAERLAAREKELEALELGLRAERPRFAEIRGLAPPRLVEVQAALTPGELLAAYLLAEPASHLWLVDRERVRHHALPGAARIEAEARRAYTSLLDPGATPELGELAASLLAPLAAGEPAPRSLVIVPWGILHYLPFDALPLAGGRVADWAPTAYAPSASALVELRRRGAATPGPRCLAVGGADYGGEAASARGGPLPRRGALGALPHSRREVERVAGRFGAGATRTLVAGEATEGRLKAEPLETYSVLHLATHGFVDASSPSRSGLVLGAGAAEEDGVLQVREILRLPLAAELVTLSACESALGELVTGEGMVGLVRAFFYAGADAVVASLWSVSDEASAELMDAFYAALAEGLPKAEALRRARLEIRGRPGWEHPYYWAPFVLVGRGEAGIQVPPRRAPWLLVGGAATLLALLVGAAARRRAKR